MSTNDRDTHFAGFAKALWAELEANIDFIPESDKHRKTFLPRIEKIIAQRSYDLVWSTICMQPYLNTIPDLSMREAMDLISDMPQLPDTEEREPSTKCRGIIYASEHLGIHLGYGCENCGAEWEPEEKEFIHKSKEEE